MKMKAPSWFDALALYVAAALVTIAPLLVSFALPDVYPPLSRSSGSAPSSAAAPVVPAGGLGDSVQVGSIYITLSSAPQQPVVGLNFLEAVVVDEAGRPMADASVTFDVDMTNMSHGLYLVDASGPGNGHYSGRVNFSMAGPWRIYVVVERPGQATARARIAFRVNA
jgi:hypothetical protein